MILTEEQRKIINSEGNIKINAVAGSGKTTTVIAYAQSRPSNSKILYLAFNKSVKLEAQKKFQSKQLFNVQVETAHSLAYKHIVVKEKYAVRASDYKTHDVVSLLKIKPLGEKHSEYILANHVLKFVAYFCNSNKEKVQELNYLETITDPTAKVFIAVHYPELLNAVRVFLNKMNSKEIEITHDFYLKKFQLSRPNLNFDYILFDEGQDASPAMLDVFINQKATKVIVGDTHQQIYGWRYAVNSLEKVDFESFNLSNSFRFRQEIADLASQSLLLKNEISDIAVTTTLVGQGNSTDTLSRAVIARSNLGLLLNAIKMVYEEQSIDSLYFEGNINSYTYADEGASLYDVLNLRNQEHPKIKDVLIKSMRDLDDLEDYIKKTEDVQLGMLLEIVNEYGNEIPKIIKTLKLKHVENHLRDSAEVIFSTVHRCKGMEYDDVYLVDDFITKEKIASLPEDYFSEEKNIEKTNEEINLLYVAITRTRNILRIPLDMVPDDFELSERIKLTDRDTSEDEEQALEATQTIETKEQTETLKSYSFEEVRKTHTEAYQLWTEELDFELTTMFCGKVSISAMAIHFGRTRGAISSRIKKLELEEKYG